MIKRWIIRTILSLTQLSFFTANAQNKDEDTYELLAWYVLHISDVDKNASNHHLQSVSKYVKDSTGERIVFKEVYDKKGYRKKRVNYSINMHDSIETVINRISKNEAVVLYKITGNGNYDSFDEDNPRSYLQGFFDTLSSNSFLVVSKAYKRLSGKTIKVTTSVNGRIKRIYNLTMMSDTRKSPVYPPGDTIRINDTVVVSYQEKDDFGKLTALKISFIKGIKDPVKTEYLTYVDDSLTQHSVYLDEYDKKKRHISHSESQGVPLSRSVIKRTIYNDSTGERMETEGYNPDSGKPTRLWRYDKAGQIIYYESPEINVMDNGKVVWHRDKASTVFNYNKKGLIEEDVSSLNDIPVEYTFYKYTYHK
jgi:hypothetical protein